MRWAVATAVVVVLVALLAGGAAYRAVGPARACEADPVSWVVREFRLGEAEAAEVRRLHEAYGPVCEAHCEAIRTVRAEVARLERDGAAAGEVAAAKAEAARLDAACRESLDAHLARVAAVIGGVEGQRYLALVRACLADFDHGSVPGVDGREATDPHAAHGGR